MPFNVQAARNAGYSDAEIVDHLAKAGGFDAAGARSAGYSDAELITHFLGKDPVTGQPRTESTGPINSQPQDELARRKLEAARKQSDTDRVVTEWSANPANPANSGGAVPNFLAGVGKSFVDTARGVRQVAPAVGRALFKPGGLIREVLREPDAQDAALRKEQDQVNVADAPLMRTAAGSGGNTAGLVAQTAPLVMVPGGATVLGSGATGALTGAIQPVGTDESRGKNATIGALAGIAGPVVARTGGAIARGAKALIEPLTEAGQQRIAGRALERFGVTPADVAGLSNAPTTTGAKLTLPEQIARPEGAAAAARLQDSLRAASPDVAAKFEARDVANNAARVSTLEGLAAPRDAAVAARTEATKPLYDAASAQTFVPTKEFAALAERPAVKAAMSQAQANAANAGSQIEPNSVELLHQTKLALDDAIATLRAGKPSAATNAEASALIKSQKDLTDFIESQSKNYASARQNYAALSKPVNQADIAGEVLKRGSANTTDLAGTPRLMPNALTGAVRDEGKLMKQATGRDLGKKLSDVLSPDQLSALNAVVGEVDRSAAVARAGNGPGSGTAQRLAGQNVLKQTLGKTGLPADSIAESTAMQTLMKPIQFAYNGVAEPKIQMTLAELILDPSKANAAFAAMAPEKRKALAAVLQNPYLKQIARQTLPSAAAANE